MPDVYRAGGNRLAKGSQLTINAKPGLHQEVLGWQGVIESSENPLLLTVNGNSMITAQSNSLPFEIGFEAVRTGSSSLQLERSSNLRDWNLSFRFPPFLAPPAH